MLYLWMKKEICEIRRNEEQAKIEHVIENDDRPSFRMVTTCRGFGGSERSSLHIMKMFLEDGYRVELIPTGNVSGEYLKNIPKEVIYDICCREFYFWKISLDIGCRNSHTSQTS